MKHLRLAGRRVEPGVAEQDLRHLDRVVRPLGVGHGAHEALVAVLHVAVDHVEVPLVDRQVHGLADRAAGVVQRLRQVGELHEVAEVLDVRVPAAFVEVVDERRAVGGGEHRVRAADLDVARGIPGVLRELARRRRLDQPAAQASRHAHPLAVDVRTRGLPDCERFRVLAELDADLLEDGVGVVLDEGEALFAQHLVHRNVARYVRDRMTGLRGARDALGIAGARPAAGGGCG